MHIYKYYPAWKWDVRSNVICIDRKTSDDPTKSFVSSQVRNVTIFANRAKFISRPIQSHVAYCLFASLIIRGYVWVKITRHRNQLSESRGALNDDDDDERAPFCVFGSSFGVGFRWFVLHWAHSQWTRFEMRVCVCVCTVASSHAHKCIYECEHIYCCCIQSHQVGPDIVGVDTFRGSQVPLRFTVFIVIRKGKRVCACMYVSFEVIACWYYLGLRNVRLLLLMRTATQQGSLLGALSSEF